MPFWCRCGGDGDLATTTGDSGVGGAGLGVFTGLSTFTGSGDCGFGGFAGFSALAGDCVSFCSSAKLVGLAGLGSGVGVLMGVGACAGGSGCFCLGGDILRGAGTGCETVDCVVVTVDSKVPKVLVWK